MELINTKNPSYAQDESSSETQPTKAKTKSLLLLKNCSSNIIVHHHQEMVVSYKECLKNHAASLGGHALDGCGEFMPSPTATPTDPASLKCAACGCHRNFHRRDPYDGPAFIHHLPPPPNRSSSPSPTHSPGRSPSPTHTPPSPVPYSYYSSAPHMLLALSTGNSGPLDEYHHHLNHSNPTVGRIENNNNNNPSGRKRSRTKFSKEQKEKMHAFAERLGWRMPKSEERLLEEFCNEARVDRGVFKVWMHNNKNTFGKKEILAVGNLSLDNNSSGNNEDNGNGNAFDSNSDIHNEGSIQLHVSTNNGSSSSAS
ncbi:zinc-finger homeodomain protein 11-like [Durio zibethinus]|uniref:Zinc-finger homeodomain protein 11-like n=1 Tax=Durio zibethinus TaxID=66656 RepID=A0A6P5Y1K2_DURZI|nr:zinc-finger homeodomain protein 11-like [Durio zibethinus]